MMHLRVLSLILVSAFLAPAPDEGQWLPQQFIEMDWKKLKERGLELTKDEFWHPEKGGGLSAAVQINGCSATLVSDDGLVVTNHHCAYGAIQRASTVKLNYVENGFVAETREQEIRARGVQLRAVRAIKDVTKEIHAAAKRAKDDLDRVRLIGEERARLIREGEASAPDTECSIASFFNGRYYHLYYRTLIPDVRLVYAPPRSVGEFGGDVDNWEWPRHTGDFTFLRAYVGPDGKPAPFHKRNVPYRPKHWIKVSGTGVSQGDLVMILGYPGRTDRYRTSVAIQAVQQQLYPLRYRYYTELISILEERSKGNAELQLRYSSNIKSFANAQKNALGMVKGLARNGVVARKGKEEAQFTSWVKGQSERIRRYGNVLDEVLALDREEASTRQRDFLLSATTGNCQLLTMLMDIAAAVSSRTDQTPWGEVRRAARGVAVPLSQRLEWLEKPMLSFIVDELHRLPDSQRLPGQDAIIGNMNGREWVEAAFADTLLIDGQNRRRLFIEGKKAASDSDEPLMRLARLLGPEIRDINRRNRLASARRLVVGQQWIAAQQKWRGQAFYPDANSTLRVSVATVKGYAPRDGVFHSPQTTLSGVLQKETGKDPFASPSNLVKAANSGDLGRFTDKTLGDVPVCFLSDGDTTGGNSGSGVINGKGELVGLNFDRVFENVAGDYGWNPDRSRNISVDIRYVLWQLEKVRPAPALLKELGF
ncbi:MAG: peptidase [Planctomycetes bacterium]|nr:peptidase [Planctomycetota bacterium]